MKKRRDEIAQVAEESTNILHFLCFFHSFIHFLLNVKVFFTLAFEIKFHCYVMQGKAANAITLASNTVRWVLGPTGTIVTFSEDMGLPSIFDPVRCR
jgi:hypothetical protein